MSVHFSDEEVMKATGARLLQKGRTTAYHRVCTDTRALSAGCLFVALKGPRFDAHQFVAQAASGGAQGAVVKRGHPLPTVPKGLALFEVEDTLTALGALARFHRQRFHIPVGAITGS